MSDDRNPFSAPDYAAKKIENNPVQAESISRPAIFHRRLAVVVAGVNKRGTLYQREPGILFRNETPCVVGYFIFIEQVRIPAFYKYMYIVGRVCNAVVSLTKYSTCTQR